MSVRPTLHDMQSNRVLARARVLIDDAGQSAPTPLFIAFLTAIALTAIFAFRRGVSVTATLDFLVLATAVSLAALTAFGFLLLWSTRAGHRASNLAAARPGATVIRGTRAFGLTRAVRASQTTMPFVPLGLTLIADDTGFEWWAGSAEHPVRLGRTPWESIDAVRATRVTRWGRLTGGITVGTSSEDGAEALELPFAVMGAGLGGLFSPEATEIEELVAALDARRAAAYTRL